MGKRIFALMLSLILLLSLFACGTAQGEKPVAGSEESMARFKIIELQNKGFLGVQLLVEREDIVFVSFADAICYDEENSIIDAADLCPGMVVDIYWDGLVQESYPAQIGRVTVLQVAERQDDLVGLYRQVLHDLWENDSALNDGVSRLGFDFGSLTNLSEGEKTALAYLFSCDIGLGQQCVFGTWQELCNEGYIDDENLYWEDGVFLSLSVTGEGNGTFTFDAEKWRSGTGAIWFKDCEADRGKDGQWSYEIGSFAIA